MGEQLPLFGLDLVALPGELIPLHVFEERYKAMFAHCIDGDAEFGIVWDQGRGPKAVGCACVVERVVRRFDDGRLDVLTRATRPFRVQGAPADVPWPAAAVEFLADKDEAVDRRAAEQARRAYADLVEEITDEEPDAERLAEMGAYAMAATVELGNDARQSLLDLRSENARLRLVDRLFRAGLRRLGELELQRARAASNGKLRFS